MIEHSYYVSLVLAGAPQRSAFVFITRLTQAVTSHLDTMDTMDDTAIEDEKKPFDAEHVNDDDVQPDPDEELIMQANNGRVWLVKVCISLTM